MARLLSLGVTIVVTGLCLLPCWSQTANAAPASPPLSPLVFVPGKAGNRLEAKLEKTFSREPNCPTQMDWHRIWMDVWQLLPGEIECWSENLFLHYNATSGEFYDTPGVSIRVPGWGSTESVEFVDPSWMAWVLGNVGSYASRFIEGLVQIGYRRDKNLFAAPYDFRFGPASQPEFHRNLKDLIENTYAINGDSKVVLLGHSNGGIMSLFFLNLQSQEWKDKYIKAFVSVNTPYSGAPISTLMYTSGYNWGIEAVNTLMIREQQRSYESSAVLLPRAPVFSKEDTLIITPVRNYSAADYQEYYDDIEFETGWQVFMKAQASLAQGLKHPGVDTVCAYSTGLETITTLVYKEGEFPDKLPSEYIYGVGDGTVPLSSLISCETIMRSKYKDHKLSLKEFYDADHTELMYDKMFLNTLEGIVKL